MGDYLLCGRQAGLRAKFSSLLLIGGGMRNDGCTGKVRYRDHEKAINALRCIARLSTREVIPHRAYQCSKCRGWHTTSKLNYTDRAKAVH